MYPFSFAKKLGTSEFLELLIVENSFRKDIVYHDFNLCFEVPNSTLESVLGELAGARSGLTGFVVDHRGV
ncbi:hypothetical protein [Rhodohalobacter sulfatireducens]|uniref:Uncharacterized protein n=1 Tax=Rhodohalobacter sulfatireducens TaxID=2911366 RepID=A0ABS9KJ79_9BACT|nr:hypothetical protein [Rhodohalobacter sulfatireducens]MCG2590899.1 hypothetical protein [Rhodohalobacter sulfatireducens]